MIAAFEPAHLDFVMANLSSQSAAEAVSAGVDLAQLRRDFETFATTGETEVRTLMVGDAPGAVLAIARRNGAAVTFLIAATGFFVHSIKNLRELRAFLRNISGRFGIIYTVSKSPHPNTDRWFKALGYRVLDISTDTEKVYAWG